MHRVRSGAGRYRRVFYTERDAEPEGRGGDRPSFRHWRQYRQCHPRAAGRRMQRRGCNRHHGKPAEAGVDLTGDVTMIASQDDVRAVAGAEPVPRNLLLHLRDTVCEADESSSFDLEKRSRTVSVDIGGGELEYEEEYWVTISWSIPGSTSVFRSVRPAVSPTRPWPRGRSPIRRRVRAGRSMPWRHRLHRRLCTEPSSRRFGMEESTPLLVRSRTGDISENDRAFLPQVPPRYLKTPYPDLSWTSSTTYSTGMICRSSHFVYSAN